MQNENDTDMYMKALGSKTFADLQGAKLKLPTIMQPSKRCCLWTAQMYLQRASMMEVLAPSANIDFLKPERMSQYDGREAALDWLAMTCPAPPAAELLEVQNVDVRVGSECDLDSPQETRSSTTSADVVAATSAAAKALEGLV